MNTVCVEIVTLMIDYVDGDLPADKREEFERHMCGCMPCFVYLETYQTTIRLTRALPKCDPLPAEMEGRLLAMLAAAGPESAAQ